MCHGFLAGDAANGRRLSQAVGYAFSVYLERIQRLRRSIRLSRPVERFVDNVPFMPPTSPHIPSRRSVSKEIAIDRPHASPAMLDRFERPGSLRLPNAQSPFKKRQLSLRLPSNSDRQRAFIQALVEKPVKCTENEHSTTILPDRLSEIGEKEEDTKATAWNKENDDCNSNNIMSINQNSSSTSCTNLTVFDKDMRTCEMITTSTSSTQTNIVYRSAAPTARVHPYQPESIGKFISAANLNRLSQVSPTVSEILEAETPVAWKAARMAARKAARIEARNEIRSAAVPSIPSSSKLGATNRSFDEEWLAADSRMNCNTSTNPFCWPSSDDQ